VTENPSIVLFLLGSPSLGILVRWMFVLAMTCSRLPRVECYVTLSRPSASRKAVVP
jgi:hypothetical protein